MITRTPVGISFNRCTSCIFGFFTLCPWTEESCNMIGVTGLVRRDGQCG